MHQRSQRTVTELLRKPAVRLALAILATSLFITVADNGPFWLAALRSTAGAEHRFAILAALFLLLFCPLNVALALGGRHGFKPLAGTLLVLSAATGFFMDRYGLLIDSAIVRSLVQTDVREAAPLVSGSLLLHVAVFGVAPALLLFGVPLRGGSFRGLLAARVAVAVLSVAVLVGALYSNYAVLSAFTQQHHALRFTLNPAYPIYSYVRVIAQAEASPASRADRVTVAADATRAHAGRAKPTLLVLVLGETARADRFSLNGYGRDTNRHTTPYAPVTFSDVTSCGTSTADSVPCLFSNLGRAGFSHTAAQSRENVLDVLARIGVDVHWRDNNTGCKDVCDPERAVMLANRTDEDLCNEDGCFDEILLKSLEEQLDAEPRDRVVVLHQRGSHGPAYYKDTPASFKAFLPECTDAVLTNCKQEEIDNAYDNTILYTDYVLSRVIELLAERAATYAGAVLYVSDHGESLGENGIYLHGFPYAVAPPEQTRVPMLLWATEELYSSRGMDAQCLRDISDSPVSHDWIFHTLLGLFDVRSTAYRPTLDLLARCSSGAVTTSRNALTSTG